MIDDLLGRLDDLRCKDEAWIQVDVAAPSASASAIAAAVADLDDIGRWWFVRKRPGVRVRVEAPGVGAAGRAAAQAALAVVGPAAVSSYEAERYRFGGDPGMDVAHDHFALDSALAVLVEQERVPPIPWSAWVLHDLCRRLVNDAGEEWDAWMRLREILTSVADATEAPPPTAATAIPVGLRDAAQRGHARIAERLRRTEASAQGVGPRSWFAAAAVFHWNRLGLSPPGMQHVVARVLGAGGDRA